MRLQAQSMKSSPLVTCCIAWTRTPTSDVSELAHKKKKKKVRSRSGPCYMFWAHRLTLGVYMVLTDRQQTHQVPVKVHQEAALEIHPHRDNPCDEWSFTSALFICRKSYSYKDTRKGYYIVSVSNHSTNLLLKFKLMIHTHTHTHITCKKKFNSERKKKSDNWKILTCAITS